MKPFIRQLAMMAVAALTTLTSFAFDFESDGIFYNITSADDRTVAVTFKDENYNSYSGRVVIPSTVSNAGVDYIVTSIGPYAFYDCPDLHYLTIGNSVETIQKYSFTKSSNIRTIIFGAAVKDIDYHAFNGSGTHVSKAIWLGNPVATLPCNINFSTASSYYTPYEIYPFLSSMFEVDGMLYVPLSMSDRTCCVIDSDKELSGNITIPKTVTYKNVEFKVIRAGGYLLWNMPELTSVDFSNVSQKGPGILRSCTGLKEVIFGESITTIPNLAFIDCSSMEELTITNNIRSIGDNVFNGCTNLKTLSFENAGKKYTEPVRFEDWISTDTIEGSVSSHEYNLSVNRGDTLKFELFNDGSFWNSVTVYFNDKKYTSTHQENSYSAIFEETKDVVIKVEFYLSEINNKKANRGGIRNINFLPGGKNIFIGSQDPYMSYPIFKDCPLDILHIGRDIINKYHQPFSQNKSLRAVTLSDDVTCIHNNFFKGCSNLTTLEGGRNVAYVGESAFEGCAKLTKFVSGPALTKIYDKAFSGCHNLAEVELGANLTSIGKEAFAECGGMTSLTSLAVEPPVCGSLALDEINKWECTLYVPAGSRSAYAAADQWKEFFIVQDASSLGTIGIDPEGTMEVYDLRGIRVGDSLDALPAGLYIIRQGSTAKKVLVK